MDNIGSILSHAYDVINSKKHIVSSFCICKIGRHPKIVGMHLTIIINNAFFFLGGAGGGWKIKQVNLTPDLGASEGLCPLPLASAPARSFVA